ncbi:MAG: DUF2312 domain-containing protein [Rhodospirillales bacterium]|nr:DUF2312 domain-containing protein [Rhodospirillales bacterium]
MDQESGAAAPQTDETTAPSNPGVGGPGVGGIAADRLKSFVERIERLEEEKAALAADIRDVFAEAKGAGFDTKIMRQILKLRKLEQDDRQEQEHLLDLYKRALGMEI